MSMFEQLAGNLINGALGGQGGANPLLGAVMGLIQNHEGGLAGLLQKFQASGLADQAASWVGTGANLPINPDQLQSALGSDTLGKLASQIGVDPSEASASLASMLPSIIDKLTPNGQVEGGDVMQQATQLLGGLFGNKA